MTFVDRLQTIQFPSWLLSKLRGVWLLPRWDGLPLNTPAFAGHTKPHVRFLELFPVQAVSGRSRQPDRISDTALIGVGPRPHDGERKNGGRSGCVKRCRMIQGGRNSHLWPRYRDKS